MAFRSLARSRDEREASQKKTTAEEETGEQEQSGARKADLDEPPGARSPPLPRRLSITENASQLTHRERRSLGRGGGARKRAALLASSLLRAGIMMIRRRKKLEMERLHGM